MGESAGRGFLRTGDWRATGGGAGAGAGWGGCERKAAKDEMAMEARDEPFWRGGESGRGRASWGDDAWTACILLVLFPRDKHGVHK